MSRTTHTSAGVNVSAVRSHLILSLVIGVSYELNPNDSHETYDLMRNPDFAAEAKKLQ
jgi:hypothetical protein